MGKIPELSGRHPSCGKKPENKKTRNQNRLVVPTARFTWTHAPGTRSFVFVCRSREGDEQWSRSGAPGSRRGVTLWDSSEKATIADPGRVFSGSLEKSEAGCVASWPVCLQSLHIRSIGSRFYLCDIHWETPSTIRLSRKKEGLSFLTTLHSPAGAIVVQRAVIFLLLRNGVQYADQSDYKDNICFTANGTGNTSHLRSSWQRGTDTITQRTETGCYEINVEVRNFPSGVYFYRIESAGFIQTMKIVVTK